ncbi:DUF177 domain-containing protein [Flavobacteriaceae bacterium TP-CH-4]|uniref:DUF177 domain-containing protein n=1 Tax=Pelagihabitans pacificus TaxID=2696054 RepID=A0A967ED65_9FLAO|nr:DUF177 domain-containing protein [Pelagihabitans pacificus]NHF59013.1 DUF177 domain-containing protein [Pelagihabitans pacificus]
MKHKEYSIPFSGLKQGKHEFDYLIENRFFETFGYGEFNAAMVNVTVYLNKTSTMLELTFKEKGSVNVDCDLTNEPFDLPIESTMDLVVKFGEVYNDENDEILIIPHGEHQINVAQYIYEMLVLAVPQKRVHPGVADGTLKSKALDTLRTLQPKEEKEITKENDPRWDALKKLITDK